jgi:quinol monooxygenase YgiN
MRLEGTIPALNCVHTTEGVISSERKAPGMSVVVIVTAFPVPEHRAEVIAAFEAAIARVHEEPGVELYALHEGPDRLVMIEKYTSEQARSQHRKGAALAELLSDLQSKLSSPLDAQVLVPHPAGNAHKGAL